jgi:glycine cleavage system regulatory protein
MTGEFAVLDAPTQTLLQDILRRESRSLLQYLQESFPWTTSDRQSAVAQVRAMSQEERDALTRVARFLIRHQIDLPYLGSFPMDFTTINFIGLDYAVPLLVKSEREAIADLEHDLPQIANADARGLVQEILTVKQRHLKDLENLAAGLPATTLR